MTSESQTPNDVLEATLAEVLTGAPVEQIDFMTCPVHGTTYPRTLRIAGQALPNDCPTCCTERAAREGQAQQVARQQQRDAIDAARRQRALEERLGRALLPKRFAEYDLAGFPLLRDPAHVDRARTVVGACRTYVNRWRSNYERGTGLVLLGPQGTGKTGLACGIANGVMRDFGASALFMSAYGCVRHQRDTWNRKGKTERGALEDLLAPDLLIVDEVGVQVGSEHEMLMLFEVLNGRYAERRPTVLISNLPMQDFEIGGQTRPGLRTFLGARILDRLQDDDTPVLTCQWPSLRGARA